MAGEKRRKPKSSVQTLLKQELLWRFFPGGWDARGETTRICTAQADHVTCDLTRQPLQLLRQLQSVLVTRDHGDDTTMM